jgi:primosomal protein N' (replication factor Y)
MVASVAFPIAVPGVFDYRIPANMDKHLMPGMAVKVDLKGRPLWGVVVRITATSPYPQLKDILELKKESWNDDSRALLQLYEWIAHYYQCELGRVFRPLVRRGVVESTAKTIAVYSFSGTVPTVMTPRQRSAAEALSRIEGWLTRDELRQRLQLSDHMISNLVKLAVLVCDDRRIMREVDELLQKPTAYYGVLNHEQQAAVETISAAIGTKGSPFLLHGITGSGKTFVYIECARRALERGLGVIILVPEISLTPQIIRRFRDALGDRIAVIHSRMSDGERRDSLDGLISGAKRVVIGVRSAILAPMANIGLIVVDEEHDPSYKQSDTDPRYHARSVAVMRGQFQSAAVVLGSATPSFESFANALSAKYRLIKISSRYGAARLPLVTIIDMNAEHRDNNWTFLSRYMGERIQATLDSGRQIILLLNRRGFSVALICKECGHIYRCPNCSVHLTYHRMGALLRCHQCNHEESAPETCAKCKGEQIKYRGTGIQKAEELLHQLYPSAGIIRMDQDTTRRKGSHVSIIDRFARKEAAILLGTQMVAKGLNFPGVSLVGVLQADIGLHIPDFRAAERTFQLVSQVAGRAGREDDCGEVVVQTYVPDEPCIRASVLHDYEGFYEQEIASRQALLYPPVNKLMRVVVTGEDEARVVERAGEIAQRMRLAGGARVTLLGPAPCIITRIENAFRYSILLKSASTAALAATAGAIRGGAGARQNSVRVTIDVDPLNML